jgi:hypothetical protein
MSLPNYTPSGVIRLGQVPWNNSYRHVRLYSSLSSQESDIQSLLDITTTNYVYVAKNRRLKVSIPAERLYHVNYCMYKNPSMGSRWIYCFVSDVEYVNDNTTELTLEVDVFQTYLYGTDWTIPPCMVEREHTNDPDALWTDEPAFDLVYTIAAQNEYTFDAEYIVALTSAYPKQNSNVIEDVLNPTGWYAVPVVPNIVNGIAYGCAAAVFPLMDAGGGFFSEELETLLNGLTYAGSIDSVVSLFTVPSGLIDSGDIVNEHDETIRKYKHSHQQFRVFKKINAPARGNTVDGYTPKNSKLLRYPYTYCKLTDFNNSTSELRYELMGHNEINLSAAVNAQCECIAYPGSYMGIIDNIEAGIITKMGALGSWNNNAYQTWIGQQGMSAAITAVGTGVALAGLTGGTSLAATSAGLAGRAAGKQAVTKTPKHGDSFEMNPKLAVGVGAAGAAGSLAQQHATHYKQPTTARGTTSGETLFQMGKQGVRVQKVQVKAAIARQIDDFFSTFGYAVNKVKTPNLTGNDNYNYVKTIGSAPKSLKKTASPMVTDGGHGTTADALSIIESCFDNGITFWHTTSNFGSY